MHIILKIWNSNLLIYIKSSISRVVLMKSINEQIYTHSIALSHSTVQSIVTTFTRPFRTTGRYKLSLLFKSYQESISEGMTIYLGKLSLLLLW